MNQPVSAEIQATAQLEIESLRRRYAQAVDSICRTGTPGNEFAASEFRKIFFPDAAIRFVVGGEVALQAIGPEEWTVVVTNAVSKYLGTQHLIGTQLVNFDSAESGPGGMIVSGEAVMVSHVQASHWTTDCVRVVIGDYRDCVRFDAAAGWRIRAMDLVQKCRWEQPLVTGNGVLVPRS